MLTDRRDLLDAVAAALLERETLEGPQLQMLLRGEPLPALGVDGAAGAGSSPRPTRGERDEDVPEGGAGSKLPDPEPMPG